MKRVDFNAKNKAEPLQKEYHHLKDSIKAIRKKKDKVLGLYEEGIIQKFVLVECLEKLREEEELIDERLVPIESQLKGDSRQNVSFELVKNVMNNFVDSYKKTITTEQRK